MSDPIKVSVVIPVYNEAESVVPLCQSIQGVFADNRELGKYEVIFLDDGSNDGSWEEIKRLQEAEPAAVKALRFRRNFGKAHALAAGFQCASGEIVITMDADLQDDPVEIPRFIERINEGYDLVSGWKSKRRDPLRKTIPSRFFNRVTSLVSGIRLHDFNCGFKAYRRQVVANLRIYGELYRFIPVLAHNEGFKVTEIAVQHHPRKHGRSKFGWERYSRGFLDLLTVVATTKYLRRPAHLFGGFGIISALIGFGCLAYLTVLKMSGQLIGQRPLLIFGVMMLILGTQFISFGLLAELFLKNSAQTPFENRLIEGSTSIVKIGRNAVADEDEYGH